MKYELLGPRVLIRVEKFDAKKDTAFKGSVILMAGQSLEMEAVNQTRGVIEQIGPTALSSYEGFDSMKVGDKVAFTRHAAIRIGLDASHEKDCEYWVMNGKDVLCIINEDKEDEVTNVR